MVVDVASRLPQHVDERRVVLAVQRHVLGQLRTEAEVRHADHAAPRGRPLHRAALRLRRLHQQHSVVFTSWRQQCTAARQLRAEAEVQHAITQPPAPPHGPPTVSPVTIAFPCTGTLELTTENCSQ